MPSLNAFDSQFRCLRPFKKEQAEHHQDHTLPVSDSEDLSPREMKIMEALDMKKYYPGKLTYDKVITLTSDIDDDVKKKPTILPGVAMVLHKTCDCTGQ